jgi:phosphoribosylformylglycinamidine synthase
MPETLMEIVQAPWKKDPGGSLVAFHDNSGVSRGTGVTAFAPKRIGQPSAFGERSITQHLTATAETHNHPTLVAPFPGAETGAGGRIRDSRAVGRAGLVHAGLAGYCVGALHLPGHPIPGEEIGGDVSRRSASPLEILIEGSNGVSDYGNKIGEPLLGGFTRSFGQMVDGERREFRKPVLYSAGFGRIDDVHVEKHVPEKGMRIVRIGGPAYRIGVGGGSASSVEHGQQDETLDFASVQRGNAQLENRANRVIQACAELGSENPIESIHDQGAGGASNVLTELMEPIGGRVDIRKITAGDETMSVLELWVAEYQEGYGVLILPERLDVFESLCARERVTCEVVGEITGSGRVIVEDSRDGTTPVDLSLRDILGDLPQKRFASTRPRVSLPSLTIPDGLTVADALKQVFLLPQVGSKGFLVRKVDRSVTGLVAQQQCCGPMQVPVANAAVTADGYFGRSGVASAMGEAPNQMLIDPASGARLAVAEMLTNLASVRISDLADVRCRANWMWAAKRAGEGALLYDAAIALRDLMLSLGIAIDGGKDSLSMSAQVSDTLVVAPGQLVIMGYAPVPDITKVATPDLTAGGVLGYLKLSGVEWRLGGSALAQSLGQLGNESPDIDDPQLLAAGFRAMQELIEEGLVTAYHDVSDGGLITAVAEMCIAGVRGASITLPLASDPLVMLFAEEPAMVFAYAPEHRERVAEIMAAQGVVWSKTNELGVVDEEIGGELVITSGDETVLAASVSQLWQWWEATSTQLEKLQADESVVAEESATHGEIATIEYALSFAPVPSVVQKGARPKVAIVRAEGTNGDREMAAACYTAGLAPWDIAMSDLLDGRITSLDEFRGMIFPGGFSFADVFGSAKGWAGGIRFNAKVRQMFDQFYDRPDTFSLGVCNGCQLMANLGWVPWRGIDEEMQPRLVHNRSGRFESRWSAVKVLPSPSLMLAGMEGSVLGIWVAHGEGQLHFPDASIRTHIEAEQLAPLAYVDPTGVPTEWYPYNPNGSAEGWTALCSPDGRHLAMMPHPERCFLPWQLPYIPPALRGMEVAPWFRLFQNANDWCRKG